MTAIYKYNSLQPPTYFPEYWNDGNKNSAGCRYSRVHSNKKQDNNNCYNYACNRDATYYIGKSSYAQPGTRAGIFPSITDGNSLKNAAVNDGLEYVGKTCPNPDSGKIVVALLVGSKGYHWVRKDRNGNWSHKDGKRPVTNKDFAGNLITNPETANWGSGYSFYGYFLADSSSIQGQGSEGIEGETYPVNICNK